MKHINVCVRWRRASKSDHLGLVLEQLCYGRWPCVLQAMLDVDGNDTLTINELESAAESCSRAEAAWCGTRVISLGQMNSRCTNRSVF